jgi:hypothetical protein
MCIVSRNGSKEVLELVSKTSIDHRIILDVMNIGCLFHDLIIEYWAYLLNVLHSIYVF